MKFRFRAVVTTIVAAIVMIIFVTRIYLSTEYRDNREFYTDEKILRQLAELENDSTETVSEVLLRQFPRKCNNSDTPCVRYPALDSHLPHLRTITVFNALPHLLVHNDSLTPSVSVFSESNRRHTVSLVIGIPTVKRPKASYLIPTLQNLLGAMTSGEKNATLIVIFIAEVDETFVQKTIATISEKFPEEFAVGLLEIFSPSPNFYPDPTQIQKTLGDSVTRTRWRAKQNLDYAFLLLHVQTRGTFYVQLEDDIITKHGFVTEMMEFVDANKNKDWFMLDFCELGFIGKFFRASELWKLIDFLLLFYKDQPSDWILAHYFRGKYCELDYKHQKCMRALDKHWIKYKPSLFQHIGLLSSLEGKVQKWKDKQYEFDPGDLFKSHDNPNPFKIETTLKEIDRNCTLVGAYEGKTYFWGKSPKKGDTIVFAYEPPIYVKSLLIVSGNVEHPLDKLYNSILEVRPFKPPLAGVSNIETNGGFYQITKFDNGVANGTVPRQLNPVSEIRITIQKTQRHSVLLSEIYIDEHE